ncbi:MAG: TonB-dependent receptor, partial [Bacteroidetes bacterium]|nr:TonB-dependent receptor [Bacteroidota bacterium]
GPPEAFIPLAYNNFPKSQLDTAYFRSEKNTDREKTGFLDVAQPYTFGDLLAGELKLGGKYRYRNRYKASDELMAPYYLNYFQDYVRNPDGSITRKDFSGTGFANLQMVGRLVLFTNFLHESPIQRGLYDKYSLNPLIDRNALRQWYELNKNGVSLSGGVREYNPNPEAQADFYDIVERVSSAYIMNTFNFGSFATLIAGARVESENNDYLAKYVNTSLGGFPTTGRLLDSTAYFKETIWLPNAHLTVRPTDFMSMRLAAYRAIARPDFNTRLLKLISRKTNPRNILVIGNPNLKNAKAWNFEVNTSFYSNTIGLFSISAFYRDIKDMFHTISDIRGEYRPDSVRSVLDTLGIKWRPPGFQPREPFSLTYAVNSSQPTKVWGFEIEHQANLSFLPGLLSNLVLSYNFSIVRSETFLLSTREDTFYVQLLPPPFPPLARTYTVMLERKGKLEGQPDFFGNIALGYDIGGFSGRVSLFFQGEYARSYSATRESDPVVQKFTRWDLSLKQKITENFSVFLNLNNFTSVLEDVQRANNLDGWQTLSSSQKYGLTGDLGVRLEL